LNLTKKILTISHARLRIFVKSMYSTLTACVRSNIYAQFLTLKQGDQCSSLFSLIY